MANPTRTAEQLQALIQERIDRIPEIKGLPNDIQEGGVVWKDPGLGGCNWTVKMIRNPDSYRPEIARIIRQVQTEFDLET